MQFNLGDRVRLTISQKAKPFGTVVGIFSNLAWAYQGNQRLVQQVLLSWADTFKMSPEEIWEQPVYLINFDERRLMFDEAKERELFKKDGLSDFEIDEIIEKNKKYACTTPECDLVLAKKVIPDTIPSSWEE